MTRGVKTVKATTSIAGAIRIMRDGGFRHLPVVDKDNEIIGIVSIGDILKCQRDAFLGEIDTLETQLLADD